MSRKRKKQERGTRPVNTGFKPTKLTPRSENQRKYIQSIRDNEIILCHGPAGTGKTHIAAGFATKMIKGSDVQRVVICRPVVGVGKDIGFLPGTTEDKVGPYLMPLFDEFSHYCNDSLMKAWAETGKLEIVPLSMMRGRTFNDTFVILDEAQNATMTELRMLLTRLGQGSKMVVSGDLNQSDLPRSQEGAFGKVIEVLNDIDGISVIELTAEDIVRHRLIGTIESRLAQISGDKL
jgi:phosphate starvation-inducible PhoH-like protein